MFCRITLSLSPLAAIITRCYTGCDYTYDKQQHKMSNLYRVYDAYSYAICQHEYVSESVHCSCPL